MSGEDIEAQQQNGWGVENDGTRAQPHTASEKRTIELGEGTSSASSDVFDQEDAGDSQRTSALPPAQQEWGASRKMLLNGTQSRRQRVESGRRARSFRRADAGDIGAAITGPRQERKSGPSRRLTNSTTRFDSRTEGGTQTPQRPSYVPSLDFRRSNQRGSSSSRTAGFPRPPQDHWDDYLQPSPIRSTRTSSTNSSSYGTGSTPRASNASSAGSLPDFPIPGLYPARRSGNSTLPQPRRGNSSFYSQYSYVAPIPEERLGQQRSHGSYASSHVIPESWDSGTLDYYLSSGVPDDAVDGANLDGIGADQQINAAEDDGTRRPVRQASMGKRHKPSLTTIRPTERSGKEASEGSSEQRSRPLTRDERDHVATMASASHPPLPNGSSPGDIRAQEEVPPSMTSSEDAGPRQLETVGLNRATSPVSPTSPISPLDPRVDHIRNGLWKGSSIDYASPTGFPPSQMGGLLRYPSSETKRPLRVDVEGVGDLEAVRASVTSLPDLIKRATRLASVLDRSRPGSRLDFVRTADEQYTKQETDPPPARRKSGSISDILASFPSPHARDGAVSALSRRPPLTTPSPGIPLDMKSEGAPNRPSPKRSCCGLPLWAVLSLAALTLLIIAAAVIIPVVVVVLPRQRNSSNPSEAVCRRQIQCQNGGSAVFDDNVCRCICVNGFAGSRCTVAVGDACASTDFVAGNGQRQSITVGSSILPLLRQGPEEFNVPLNPSKLLSVLADVDLSCNSENALVTFRTSSIRARAVIQTRKSFLIKRQQRNPPNDASGQSTRASAQSSATTTQAVRRDTTTTAAAPSTATPSARPSPSSNADKTTVDFAKVGVLYIFQETDLDRAVVAQQELQMYFNSGSAAQSVSVGNGIALDLEKKTVSMPDGRLVGGGK